MPFCTYCGQSFTRDEHLERHILTHTNVKPYKCFTCHMSFARRDLLHRHYTVHGKDQNQEPLPPSHGIIPKSAGRTPIACSNCAKTKTKCDKKFPCSRCAGRNLKCTVRPTRRTTKNAARVVQTEMNGIAGATPGNSNNNSTESSAGNSAGSSAENSPPPEIKALVPIRPLDAPAQVEHVPIIHTPAPQLAPSSLPPTPASGFAHNTPLSGYGDLMRTATLSRDGSDPVASPTYVLDWSQMHMSQMPQGFNGGRPDMMMSPVAIGFDPMGMAGSRQPEAALSYMPDLYHQGIHSMQTPMPTPGLDGRFPRMESTGSHSGSAYYQSGHSSTSTSSSISDFDAVTTAQDAWTGFRCTPSIPSSACPKTAKLNLEKLEQGLKNHDSWINCRPACDEVELSLGDHLLVTPLQEMPRDKLLAITQIFLHKALEIHKDEKSHTPPSGNSPTSYPSNFIILPPAKVLEYFLRSFANSFERFYPLTTKGTLNANEIMHGHNDKASSLLLLLMIAQGATVTPFVDARWLTGGLTEACRISLFDLIEKNIMMSGDPMVLHSALLFTVQAAWSGDKWQMDIAMGQRGMYFAMLRHSGILESQQPMVSTINQRSSVERLWGDWIQQESQSRLIYSWVMVDQDLSLFYDTAPLFSVTEFATPMPDSDGLWHASSASQWSSTFEQVHEFAGGYSSIGSGARPLSLRDLFRHFLDDAMVTQGIELTPLHLRLLLHPLQSLVCQFRQLLSCFSDNPGARMGKSVTAASTRVRLEEVQAMLQRWYALADRYMKNNPMCPLMQANLIVFHLVSLNTVTNFPEIERLARREGVDGTYQQLIWLHKRCISDVEEAIFHCGQILRLIRSMPRSIRPPWWAGSLYRVALILWSDSLMHHDALTPSSGLFAPPESSFAIDALSPDHPLMVRYLTKREGTPMLTKRDGTQMAIDNPFGVLFHCVDVIAEGVSTRFSDGIRAKLGRLAKG